MYQLSYKTRTCNHVEISQNRMNIKIRLLKLSKRRRINYVDTEKRSLLLPDARIYPPTNCNRPYTQFFKSVEDN